jgi:rod shape-determining protein MreC
METILGRFRNLIVLAAILFAQIVGLAVQIKSPAGQGDTRLIRVWAVMAITPLEKAVINSQDLLRHAWSNYVYLRGVRRENRELRAELDRMKLDQVRFQEDADMARRIQSLLAFKEQYIDSTVAAQVIGTSGSDQSRALYIDKGSNDGLRPDMAVITPDGIVGKIEQVFPGSAQVLPINDQLSGVGVALKSTRLQGILRGAANGTTTVQYIMADERVVPGEDVVTSGGDRIFPKGLPVGKVISVSPGKDLFLNIRVQPAAQLDRLEEVLVITKVTEKPPDVQDLEPIRASDILAQRLPTLPNQPKVDANGKPVTPAASGSAPAAKPNPPSAAANGQPPTPGAKPSVRTEAGATPASGSTAAGNAAVKKPSTSPPVRTAQPGSAGAASPSTTTPGVAGEPENSVSKPARKLPQGAAPPPATTPAPTPQPGADNPQR